MKNVHLAFDDDHGESAANPVQSPYLPGDGLFYFLHGLALYLSHYVVDAIDDENLFHMLDRLQFLDELLFSP